MGTFGVATGMADVLFLRGLFWWPPLDLERPDEERPASSLELSLAESDSSARQDETVGRSLCKQEATSFSLLPCCIASCSLLSLCFVRLWWRLSSAMG